MESRAPMVSVAMPAYNSERFIAETIKSILAQSYSDFEFLIRDDGSSDRTLEIIRSFDDPRIKVQQNERNMGPGATRNALMNSAQGKYIALMDADDICEPNRLQVQVDYMERNPQIDVCGSFMTIIDENGKRRGTFRLPLTHEQIKARLLFGSPMGNPSVVMRLESIREKNLRYGNRCVADDMIFWGDAIDELQFVNLKQPLIRYRIWNSQLGSRRWEEQTKDAVAVSCEQMRQIGVTLSEYEIEVYARVRYGLGTEYQPEDLCFYKNILMKLWCSNKAIMSYNPKVLRRELAQVYKQATKKVCGSHIKGRFNQLMISLQLK